jgi:hypothetical protein
MVLTMSSVEFYPPLLVSAVGVADRTIRLTWVYDREDISNFKFRRTNLATATTEEFEVYVSPGSRQRTYDDIGRAYRDHRTEPILDADTSYRYVVGAVFAPGDPEGLMGELWNLHQSVTGTTPNTPFEPTFEGALTHDDGGWAGYTLVQRIEPYALSKSGTQVRLTLRASSVDGPGGTYIERVYISKPDPAGHPYDSNDDLTQVSPKIYLRADQPLTLFTRYKLDKASPLLIAADITGPAGIKYRPVKTSSRRAPFGNLPIGTAYRRAGAEAALRNRSADYESANLIYLVEMIEVR